ncbi:unnamed protein product [Musa acuminata subsp. burmannicoides]
MLLFLSCYLHCGLCSHSYQVGGSLYLISHNDRGACPVSPAMEDWCRLRKTLLNLTRVMPA